MDDHFDTDNSVGAGDGAQLHDGGFIHILLVVAVIVILLNIIQGRRAL